MLLSLKSVPCGMGTCCGARSHTSGLAAAGAETAPFTCAHTTGCSGNPWDAEWNVGFGWGDAHELGHNMQTTQLNIHYPPPGTGDRNLWSTLVNRAGENSNNVFPYVCERG
jgi:hypothetical protein